MPEVINRFKGQYEFLSNFHRMPDGSTLEHRYQAEKAVKGFEAEHVLSAPTPAIAKRRGRQVMMRPNWEEVKRDVMLRLLRMKFADHEQYRTLLLGTGDAYLLEGNTWHDQYWGSCTCPMHYGVTGANWLGRLLMQVREELRDERATVSAGSGAQRAADSELSAAQEPGHSKQPGDHPEG